MGQSDAVVADVDDALPNVVIAAAVFADAAFWHGLLLRCLSGPWKQVFSNPSAARAASKAATTVAKGEIIVKGAHNCHVLCLLVGDIRSIPKSREILKTIWF